MSMQRKTITITDQKESWVKAQVDSSKYENDSEYSQNLLRPDQDRREAKLNYDQCLMKLKQVAREIVFIKKYGRQQKLDSPKMLFTCQQPIPSTFKQNQSDE